MNDDQPDRRPRPSGWRPPPGGYRRPEEPTPPPPPPPPPAPRPGTAWQQQPPGPYQQPSPYQQPYGQQYPPPPAAAGQGRGYTVASFICAVIALIFLPIVLGPLGAAMAGIGMSKGDPLAKWALGASIACMVIGMVLGLIVWSSLGD